MKYLEKVKNEHIVLQFFIILFWTLFWLLNVIDKFIAEPVFLWVGKNRIVQFEAYFASIGIESASIAFVFFLIITVMEIVALAFMTLSLAAFLRKKAKLARRVFFCGIIMSLIVFMLFAVGDQIFGDRAELWEHTTFWMALLVSWMVYVHDGGTKKKR